MSSIFKTVYRSTRPLALAVAATACMFGAVAGSSSSVSAAAFTYVLHDHPGGQLVTPTYGLRLDGLYGGVSNDFSFSFDQAGTGMSLVYDDVANSIRISGRAYGGIDIGSAWDSNNVGFIDVDFTYRQNLVSSGSGTFGVDTDNLGLQATDHAQTVGTGNSGSVTLATGSWGTGATEGDAFTLVDQSNGYFSFKFNNFDDHGLNGHPGYGGPDDFVGWGWINHWPEGDGPRPHIYSSDWQFVGEIAPPPVTEMSEPGMLAFLGLGVAGLVWRRRRNTA